MAKAMKEAKLNTSWVQPNEAGTRRWLDFIAQILDLSPRNRFSKASFPSLKRSRGSGAINSLSQVLLKLTAPGVPDVYQGNEIWDFSLVDPDNRRPVDYLERRKMLDALKGADPGELLDNWSDGRIKLFLTHRLLTFRREKGELFQRGGYQPLSLTGEFADCCVAFARNWGPDHRCAGAALQFARRISADRGSVARYSGPNAEGFQRRAAISLPGKFRCSGR